MSIRSPRRYLLTVWLAMMSLALTALAGGFTATAQSNDIAIMFRSWACPNGIPSDEWEECDSVLGATYRVEADGVEVEESPVTTVRDTGIGHGWLINVPEGTTTVTVTQLSGAPDGYVPAPGFDPFTANIADLPQVGFGGESTGPGIDFFNIPAGDAGDETPATDGTDAGGDTPAGDVDETTTLPETGTGAMAPAASQQLGTIGLLLIASILFGAGCVTRQVRAG